MMPCLLSEDRARVDEFVDRFGPGTVAGPRQYVIDRMGEFADEGIAEIIFGALPSGNVRLLQRFDEEILSAFR